MDEKGMSGGDGADRNGTSPHCGALSLQSPTRATGNQHSFPFAAFFTSSALSTDSTSESLSYSDPSIRSLRSPHLLYHSRAIAGETLSGTQLLRDCQVSRTELVPRLSKVFEFSREVVVDTLQLEFSRLVVYDGMMHTAAVSFLEL